MMSRQVEQIRSTERVDAARQRSLPATGCCPVTAIVTAYNRIEQTLATLRRLQSCNPAPSEILVHVDGDQLACLDAVSDAFPQITVLRSVKAIGPGGGRNKLIAASRNELVASFDDDSYPIDNDYFARVTIVAERFPEASILCAAIFQRNETVLPDTKDAQWVSDFGGGGCIYRRSAFLATTGYVPLRIAYGMEEVDLALRLHARGGKILRTAWLRVFHDSDLSYHANPRITASSIANQALLAYLRYPPSLWHVGAAQCASRVLWLIRNGRYRGVLSGLFMIPGQLASCRRYRGRVSPAQLKSYLSMRRSCHQTATATTSPSAIRGAASVTSASNPNQAPAALEATVGP